METEKSCKTCKLAKMAWPNSHCEECMSHNLKLWEPDEEIVKQYVKRCLPGENMESYDVVSKPKHYMLFEDKGIEVRDVIEQLVKKMDSASAGLPLYVPLFSSDYVQLMQYLMRFMDKNGVEDLKKARWYLDKLIEAY